MSEKKIIDELKELGKVREEIFNEILKREEGKQISQFHLKVGIEMGMEKGIEIGKKSRNEHLIKEIETLKGKEHFIREMDIGYNYAIDDVLTLLREEPKPRRVEG